MTSSSVPCAGLDAAIEARLVGSPMASGRRLLGLELERLILHRGSGESAPLDFCRDLMTRLVEDLDARPIMENGVIIKMRGEHFGVSMEPGGQLELDTDPYPSLDELEPIFLRVTAAIEARLEDTDYRLVALGHAPKTPVAKLGLLPRPRYRIMDADMPRRGALTRNMMRATAGLQMTCDIRDRADAGRRMALLNRLSPVLMSLTANSTHAAGRDTGDASYRHRVWWNTDTSRTGVPEGGLDAETAVDGYVRFARRAVALFAHGENGLVAAPHRPFEELVAEGRVTEADLDVHLTSLFPFVRLRNYIEIRCFDTVEWPLAKSVLALVSGLVYCDKATSAAEALSDPLAIRDPGQLRAFHLEAARLGLDARIPNGTGFRDIAAQLIGFAESKLGSEDCDWAKAEDLRVVRERVEAK